MLLLSLLIGGLEKIDLFSEECTLVIPLLLSLFLAFLNTIALAALVVALFIRTSLTVGVVSSLLPEFRVDRPSIAIRATVFLLASIFFFFFIKVGVLLELEA